MSWLPWLAVAMAGLLLALPSRAAVRTLTLATSGRLVTAPGEVSRVLPRPRLPGVAAGCAIGLTAVLGLVEGFALAISFGVVIAVIGVLVRDIRASRDTAARRSDLLAAVRVLTAEIGAGARPASALDAAAGAGPRFAPTFTTAAGAARTGDGAGRVLAAAADPDLRRVGLAWTLGETTGAALGGVLQRVCADLVSAQDQRRAAAVALAGPRSSAFVLAALPVLGIGLGTAMGAHPVSFLLDASAGRALCCAGVVLDAAGILWIRAIVRRAERL